MICRSINEIGQSLAQAVTFLLVTLLVGSAAGQTKQVYILTGQSNSLGTTSLEGATQAEWGPGANAADAQTPFFWSNVTPSNSAYPPTLLGDSGAVFKTLEIQQGEGANTAFWGPEFGFGRRMAEQGQNEIVIIKASRGGGGNSLWDKDVFEQNANSGHMWGHLRDQVDVALGVLDSQPGDFQIRGLMYLQGESNNASEAQAADTRLESLVNNLTQHIETSFPGTTNDFHTVIGEIAASGSSNSRQTTTTLQTNLAANNNAFSFVATADLPLKSDGVHFGRDAKLTIGERFADSLLAVLQQPNDIQGDVNQDGVLFGDGSGLAEADDVTAFLAGWGSDTTGLTNLDKTKLGDLNLDGATTLVDAFLLHQAFEAQGEAFPFELLSGQRTPEPASMLIAAVVVSVGPLLRPRRSALPSATDARKRNTIVPLRIGN